MLQDTPSFLAYWRNAQSRTVRVRSALGPEDLAWAPVPGAFTFGDPATGWAGAGARHGRGEQAGRRLGPMENPQASHP